MAYTTTTNYGLKKGSGGSGQTIEQQRIYDNENADTIDSTMKSISNAANAAQSDADTAQASANAAQSEVDALENIVSTKASMTTSNLTYYVATTGSDANNDGLSASTPFLTISKAISMIPLIVNHVVVVNVAAGVYAEEVYIDGFSGKSSITLNGGTNLQTAVNYAVQRILAANISCRLVINGFTATSTSNNSFIIVNTTYCFMNYCLATSTSTYNVFYIQGGVVLLNGCKPANHLIALAASNCSTVYSDTWDTGSGNTYGLYVTSGATVVKNGTQPQGTTAEHSETGGVIR